MRLLSELVMYKHQYCDLYKEVYKRTSSREKAEIAVFKCNSIIETNIKRLMYKLRILK